MIYNLTLGDNFFYGQNLTSKLQENTKIKKGARIVLHKVQHPQAFGVAKVDKKNKIMLEYVLLKGVNDTKKDAEALASYGNKLRCKINVIPFNDIGNKFSRPDDATINRFIETLYENQIHYQLTLESVD